MFIVFKKLKTVVNLFIYSLIGMLFVQYAYISIATGNVAVAHSPIHCTSLYITFNVIRNLDVFRPFDILAITMTLIGTFLLLTNGSISI